MPYGSEKQAFVGSAAAGLLLGLLSEDHSVPQTLKSMAPSRPSGRKEDDGRAPEAYPKTHFDTGSQPVLDKKVQTIADRTLTL